MNSMWTVTAFTIRNKMRNKAYIWTTVVLAVLLVVVANIPYFLDKLNRGADEPTAVGYLQGQQDEIVGGLKSFYAKQEKPDVKLVAVPAGSAGSGEDALRKAIADGKIDGYLLFEDGGGAGFPNVVYKSEKMLDTDTSQSLQTTLQNVKVDLFIRNAGLDDAAKEQLFAPVHLTTLQIAANGQAGKTEAEQGTAIGLTYAIIVLLFMAVMITGQLIASEITAEKSSRVMEILVTSVSPLKQMFGKILGTFVAGIFQIVVLGAAFVANLTMPQNRSAIEGLGIRLDSIDPMLIVYALFFYLAGYFLYATLFAAVGSIVSRTEDLGQAVMPITMLTLVGFYIAIFGLSHPTSPVIAVCSFIPFFAPFLMFLRIGLESPPVWQIALSIGILLASVLAIGWLSAKIYRVGVLMYGKRPSVKDVAKAIRAYKV